MKRQILFVDSEQALLSGLRRALRTRGVDWTLHFASTAEEALALFEQHPIEVLVTDIEMLDADGNDLVARVAEARPETMRIVLSAESEQLRILQSLGPAHRYLAKPCDPAVLERTIQRALGLRDVMFDEALQRVVREVDELPTLPAVYRAVLAETKHPRASLGRIGRLIEQDIALSAQILKVVNSAYFGTPQRIRTASHAVNYLGLDIVSNLLLALQLMDHGGASTSSAALAIDDLWRHSLLVASLGREIARRERWGDTAEQDAFTAGMLHGVGRIVLSTQLSEEYRTVLYELRRGAESVQEVERRHIGTTHLAVSSYLLALWGLPDTIVEAIAHAYTPAASPSPESRPLTALHAALSLAGEIEWTPPWTRCAAVDRDYLETIGLAAHAPRWARLAEAFDEEPSLTGDAA